MDSELLLNSTKKLHGYTTHLLFANYLAKIAEDGTRAYRLYENEKFLESAMRGMKVGGTRTAVDGDAMHLYELAKVVGLYSWVFMSHEKADYRLADSRGMPRILFLRGFAYQDANAMGSAGMSIMARPDSLNFINDLYENFSPDRFVVCIPLSPEDLEIETSGGLVQYVYEKDGIHKLQKSVKPYFYLNANYWQEDVACLASKADHFLVYVTSITDSIIWELDLLKRTGCTDRTIVIFDEKSLTDKAKLAQASAETLSRIRAESGELASQIRSTWTINAGMNNGISVANFRELLDRNFPVVVSRDEFFANIDTHKEHFSQSLRSDSKSSDKQIPFRFHPALDSSSLKQLRDFDQSLDISIRQAVNSRRILNLPWFFHQIQARIFTSLVLGDHRSAGHALAMYGVTTGVASEELSADMSASVYLSESEKSKLLGLLRQNFACALEASYSMMTIETHALSRYGLITEETCASEFESNKETVDATRKAVSHYFNAAKSEHRGIRMLAPTDPNSSPAERIAKSVRDGTF